MYNKIFLGYQLRQMVEWRKNQRFKDHLRPHPQGTEVAEVPTCVICIYLSEPRVLPSMVSHLIVVTGFVCPNDQESYAGSSLATGRVSQARQVSREGPDKEGHPGPPG
jgi:hypothetical protein